MGISSAEEPGRGAVSLPRPRCSANDMVAAGTKEDASAGSSRDKSQQDSQSPATSKKSFADAFFRGEIRDRTTKESRKAADCLSALKTIKKNPSWVPVDSRTKMLKQSSKKAGLPPAELAKMRALIADTVPSEIVDTTTRQIAEASSSAGGGTASSPSAAQFKNPMLSDVEAEIHRRIQELGKSGKMFEEHAAYNHDVQLAADAPLIVQGIDPAAARSEERFVQSRRIVPQRKHWMASKTGFYTTSYGTTAYVHTDGSVAMFPSNGKEHRCRCGMLHTT